MQTPQFAVACVRTCTRRLRPHHPLGSRGRPAARIRLAGPTNFRTFTAAAFPRWTVRQISGGAARLIQSRCGGRQLPDECLKQPPRPAGCLSLVAGVSRRATAGLYARYSAEQRRRPPTRSRWPGCAGGSGVVLELLQLASSIIWIGSRMSTPRWDHQVCRHPCTSALTGMLTRTGCALLGRLWDHSKEPPMSLFHPSTNCESDRPRL